MTALLVICKLPDKLKFETNLEVITMLKNIPPILSPELLKVLADAFSATLNPFIERSSL